MWGVGRGHYMGDPEVPYTDSSILCWKWWPRARPGALWMRVSWLEVLGSHWARWPCGRPHDPRTVAGASHPVGQLIKSRRSVGVGARAAVHGVLAGVGCAWEARCSAKTRPSQRLAPHRGGSWLGASVWFKISATGPGLPGALAGGTGATLESWRGSLHSQGALSCESGMREGLVLRPGCAQWADGQQQRDLDSGWAGVGLGLPKGGSLCLY